MSALRRRFTLQLDLETSACSARVVVARSELGASPSLSAAGVKGTFAWPLPVCKARLLSLPHSCLPDAKSPLCLRALYRFEEQWKLFSMALSALALKAVHASQAKSTFLAISMSGVTAILPSFCAAPPLRGACMRRLPMLGG